MSEKITIKSGFNKILFTVITQIIILVLSVITGFILPRKMGPENYGYWQLYLFYLAYLNVFGLGFNDGIALFYGGYEFDELPLKKIRSSMLIMYFYLFIITVVSLLFINYFTQGIYKTIFIMLVLNIPITCIQCVILTTFLSVNKTFIYNFINLLTKILACLIYVGLIFLDYKDAKMMIAGDFFSRLLIFIICVIIGRKILFGEFASIKEGLMEFKEKSKSGINITLAIIASMFIPVSGRMIIGWYESIATYGIYSFAMSLLTIIMMFTTAAGYVVFPMLKKMDNSKLSSYYNKLTFICDSIIVIALLAYIPLVIIIKYFLKEYLLSLDYLYILLAMCIPLGRMQLIITPYYKAYRLEKQFLISNIFGIILMLGISTVIYNIFKSSVTVAICSTVIITLWTFLTEKYLAKKIKNQYNWKGFFLQIFIMVLFITAGSFKSVSIFSIIYLTTIALYFILNKKESKSIINIIKVRRK